MSGMSTKIGFSGVAAAAVAARVGLATVVLREGVDVDELALDEDLIPNDILFHEAASMVETPISKMTGG